MSGFAARPQRRLKPSITYLSEKLPGDIITVPENGVSTEFIVLRKESDNTLVIRKYIHSKMQFNTTNVNTYNGSVVDNFCEKDYLYRFPVSIRATIPNSTIQYTQSGTASAITTMQRHVFLLSSYELGLTSSNFNNEGNQIPYFIGAGAERIALFNGVATEYWTRTPFLNEVLRVGSIMTSGNATMTNASTALGVRPAFYLPNNTAIDSDNAVMEPTVPNPDPIFANNSWLQIAYASEKDKIPATWLIGDEKNITLSTNEVLTMQIYGKKHDDLPSGGKAGLSIGMKHLMKDTRRMNATNTNANGFTGSELYTTWLTTVLWNQLPADLRIAMHPVNKKTSAGSNSSVININLMLLFLYSAVECGVGLSYPGEGETYPIFTDDNSRTKRLSNGIGSGSDWRTRSPATGQTTYFVTISDVGKSTLRYSNETAGICFGFCI